jgi:hypothetical protein
MATIWRQQLAQGCGAQTFRLPFGVHFLDLAMKDDKELSIWFVVDPEAEPVECTFYTVGTGHTMENYLDNINDLTYLGTYQIPDSDGSTFVGHVFVKWDY